MPPRLLLPLAALILAACAGTGPGGAGGSKAIDYDKQPGPNDFDRDGFGTSGLPLWMGLTEPEKQALGGRDRAAEGDPSALLDLAIFASGDVRDEAGYLSIRRRVEAFVIENRKAMDDQKSHVGKGRVLFKAMHAGFFPSPFWKSATGSDPRLAGYDFEESAFTAIFLRKKFNCVSSAILYVVLARYYGLDARGVALTSHAFAQITTPEGKVIEIETTTPEGYNLVHDASFYAKKGPSWASARGLAPTTFASYLDRRIMSPLELIGWNTNNQHVAPARMSQLDRSRLAEAWGYLVPKERDAQANRLAFYNMEFRWLKERRGWSTLESMYRVIGPELPKVKADFSGDGQLQNRIAWTWFEHALVLDALERGAEAVPLLDSALATARPEWKEGVDVKSNSVGLLQNIAAGHVEAGRFAEAEAVLERGRPHAAGDTNYPRTRSWMHQKWALKHWNAGNWPAALAQFEKQESVGMADDKVLLRENMIHAYVNWAVDAQQKGDLKGTVKALARCKEKLKAKKCVDLLNRLSAAAGP